MRSDGDEHPPPPRREGRLARLRQAPATAALLATIVVVFVASTAYPSLAFRFAKDSQRVRAGELWRLVTANFLHGSVLHLLVNGWALYVIGPAVEHLYGRLRFIVVFVLGGAVGFAASTVFVPQPSLGASAGLFAFLGVLLAFSLRAGNRIPRAARRAMTREILTVAALNLALGFMVPFIDNAAHLGGFAAGFAMGLVLRPRGAP